MAISSRMRMSRRATVGPWRCPSGPSGRDGPGEPLQHFRVAKPVDGLRAGHHGRGGCPPLPSAPTPVRAMKVRVFFEIANYVSS